MPEVELTSPWDQDRAILDHAACALCTTQRVAVWHIDPRHHENDEDA